ncbi:AcrR family transcriptional regulator [Aeromicrobium panaciterrae]|uniref:AcrR family transcriptional regulator n=1 Tax=Aeromicrobium panaciterrae TaxID=363861 RepID=A0ABU1UMF5_9ACTN|nr:TetR/AcrR family transcriptional regulator [Aeromicrobium panaciterrae]MDR7086350.1 AcrR family transcriptional regulator [Aeromicrobium panaciterrae]
MRSHGWGGRPPCDAEEARARILVATVARIAEVGTTSTSEIADLLGVTRQTVYRYFPTTNDLLNAASLYAVGDLQNNLVEHMVKHLQGSGDPAEAIVEVVAYVYEHLRDDPVLSRLVAPGQISSTLSGLTLPSSIALGVKILSDFGVDWSAFGLAEDEQVELVEHLLRMLQSFFLDPGDPARDGQELRSYLRRWVAPALRAVD